MIRKQIKKIPKKYLFKWAWMPHAGHFICAKYCRFHLNTYVGGYIVSTVGEYVPDSEVREIFATARGISLEGRGDERLADYMEKIGYEELGYQRLYETMVFKAKKSDNKCCPYTASNWMEEDTEGYNTAEDAYKGHLRMCKKWGRKTVRIPHTKQ